ncbi:MAG: dTMP kinase [Actinomycetota bacterium]
MKANGNAEFPGRLFIVEGVDGSGKSTQLDLLHKWLVSQGFLVVFSEWNSSPIVKGTTKRGKKRHLLSPISFSLIHAADFANRIYQQILPALHAGAIVVADRYVYTAFARDAARGVSRKWIRDLYAFAPKPTLSFYFDVPLQVASSRIMEGRPELKYYEAGLDLGLADDPEESFRIYQGLIKTEYELIVPEFGLVRMDATERLVVQQQRMRDLVAPHLEGLVHGTGSGVSEALRSASLVGRYLDEVSHRVTQA